MSEPATRCRRRARGRSDPDAAARAVREMFTSIAPRYDLLNHVLSFNVDRLWWRETARTFAHILVQPDARVLDLCCGTGDMTFALLQAGRELQSANSWARTSLTPCCSGRDQNLVPVKRQSAALGRSRCAVPPVSRGAFDLVTSAFGFRNLADYDAGLREIVRVLRPGGECGILDFGEPKGLVGKLYRFYFKHVLPARGYADFRRARPLCLSSDSVERFPGSGDAGAHAPLPGSAKRVGRPTRSGSRGCIVGRSERRPWQARSTASKAELLLERAL